MLYTILFYHDEDVVGSWSQKHNETIMNELGLLQDKLTEQGRLGPVAWLLPTTTAVTLRKGDPPLVLDGPYAETKEQFLAFYIVDCVNLDDALEVAYQLESAIPGGAFEVRPVGTFMPGENLMQVRRAGCTNAAPTWPS